MASILPLVLLAMAAPAWAHGRGSDATNYRSTLTDEAGVAGLEWRIWGNDEYLGLTNTTGEEVVIYGYQPTDPEEYLRIGPDGAFENRNSTAYYLNLDRYARQAPPEGTGADVEPDWVKVSDAPSWAWHDHRIHWMGLSPPPQVQADPAARTPVNSWQVPYRHAGSDHAVTGELEWVPPTSPIPWVAVAVAVVGVPALLGLRTQPQESSWPGLARPAALVLGVIAAANLIHLVDDLVATPTPLTTRLIAAVQTVLFIGIGIFGAVRAWQAREGAFTALGVGAGSIFVGQGLLYVSVLGSSQVASVFPAALTKGVVAFSLAQALPLGIVAVLGTRRLFATVPDARDEEAGAPAVG